MRNIFRIIAASFLLTIFCFWSFYCLHYGAEGILKLAIADKEIAYKGSIYRVIDTGEQYSLGLDNEKP